VAKGGRVTIDNTARASCEIGKSLQNSGGKMPLVGGYEDSIKRLGVQSWQAAGAGAAPS